MDVAAVGCSCLRRPSSWCMVDIEEPLSLAWWPGYVRREARRWNDGNSRSLPRSRPLVGSLLAELEVCRHQFVALAALKLGYSSLTGPSPVVGLGFVAVLDCAVDWIFRVGSDAGVMFFKRHMFLHLANLGTLSDVPRGTFLYQIS